MIKYCAGLLFDKSFTHVALVEKNRPEFLKGLHNAIGGKLEEGEDSRAAMVREFQEETGQLVEIWFDLWVDTGSDYQVDFYWAAADLSVQTQEDEPINVFDVNNLPEKLAPNIGWLIRSVVGSKRHRDMVL